MINGEIPSQSYLSLTHWIWIVYWQQDTVPFLIPHCLLPFSAALPPPQIITLKGIITREEKYQKQELTLSLHPGVLPGMEESVSNC